MDGAARPISRRQLYYYAMKLRDRLDTSIRDGPSRLVLDVRRLDEFLRQVDRYCFVNLHEAHRSVEQEQSHWVRQARLWLWAGAVLTLLSIITAGVLLWHAAPLTAARAGGGILMFALAAALLALRGWDAAEGRRVLSMQLALWEQALRSVASDESARVFGLEPAGRPRTPWHSTWN